jgi:hypothetical protein
MGKLPRKIAYIHDRRDRNVTFQKRYAGLLKKIYELSVLCNVEVNFYVVEPTDGRVRMFSSSDQVFYPNYSIIKKEDRKGPVDVQYHYNKVKKPAHKPAHSERQLKTATHFLATREPPPAVDMSFSMNLPPLAKASPRRQAFPGSQLSPPVHGLVPAQQGAMNGAVSPQPKLRLERLYRTISPKLSRCEGILALLSGPFQLLV